MEGFLRPEASVLDEHALVPEENVISPSPNQFTHELKRSQPYFFSGPKQGRPPDGELSAGTQVLLLRKEEDHCWAADGRGLYVEVDCDNLKKL